MPEETPQPEALERARDKVRQFPDAPGVYLLKDDRGRVIYVGKAKSLRHRAATYFTAAAAADRRTADLVRQIADVDFLPTDSEVDAVLAEARLIKDIQPKFNVELKDSKTFPYLMITTRDDFPGVYFTREPRSRGVKLFGPFASAADLRAAIQTLQRIFRFRTCTLKIREGDPKWRYFRPCLLYYIRQCTAPCNEQIDRAEYRRIIQRLIHFLEGDKPRLMREMTADMKAAAQALEFEKAARLRDQIQALERLSRRGELQRDVQPEVFYGDSRTGLAGLRQVFRLKALPRTIEGVDIAHLAGREAVGSLVQFIDGVPLKNGYRRYRIRMADPGDDYGAIREVVARRLGRLSREESPLPDLLLVDGGRGQLAAAVEGMQAAGVAVPLVVSLAKQEEVLFIHGREEPLRLSRHSAALRLLQYVRDEAHRFAQHYHHILRRKRTLGESPLSGKSGDPGVV